MRTANMRCQEFRELMDSYLGDELLIETNHEVQRHLENCPACRGELAARRELLAQMRLAIKNAPETQINPVFAAKLKNQLRETALRPTVWEKLKSGFFVNSPIFAAVAACLLFAVLFGAIWLYRPSPTENAVVKEENQTNKIVEPSRSPESPANKAVQIAWRELTYAAIGDHKNCALHFRLTEKPITLTEAAAKYGRFNKDLDKVVKTSLQQARGEKVAGKTIGEIKFLAAHSCVFKGRRFAHIILRTSKKTISVLVTDAEDSFDETNGTTIVQPDENFQVAQFRAARHAIFVVSDLSERENLAIAEMLAPAVRRHIERAEA